MSQLIRNSFGLVETAPAEALLGQRYRDNGEIFHVEVWRRQRKMAGDQASQRNSKFMVQWFVFEAADHFLDKFIFIWAGRVDIDQIFVSMVRAVCRGNVHEAFAIIAKQIAVFFAK